MSNILMGAVGALCLTLSLVGCTSGGAMEETSAADARDEVVRIVEKSTEAVGGEWKVYSGPAESACSNSSDTGISYEYIMYSNEPSVDPRVAIGDLAAMWKDRGISTEQFDTGGSEVVHALRGAGGPTTSISFVGDPRRFTITADSECADNAE